MNPIPYLCRLPAHIRAAVHRYMEDTRADIAIILAIAEKEKARALKAERRAESLSRRLEQERELNMWLITRGFEFGCRGNWINHERDTHTIGVEYSLNKSMSMEPPDVIMRQADKQRHGVSIELACDSFTLYERAARRADLAQCYLEAIGAAVQRYAQPAMLDLLGMPEEAKRLRDRLETWRKTKP